MSRAVAGVELPDGYRVERFGASEAINGDALIAFWLREGVLDAETAGRRVHEALFVALGPGDELAGVGTVSLQRSRQLRLSFWNYGSVVGAAHRRRHLSTALTWASLEHLQEQWVSGEDRRAAGMMLEFQHKALLAAYRQPAADGWNFVGLNRGGHPLSVFYFPGATAPVPEPAPEPRPRTTAPGAGERPAETGPVFVVAPPGSNATALRDALAASPELELTTSGAGPHPSERDWSDDRLDAAAATPEAAHSLRAALAGRTVRHEPVDGLRVPFLHAVFPDAMFIYLYRDPAEAVPAALAAWEAGWDASYPELPGWDGPPWSFALTPGWRALRGKTLAEVAAAQWEAVTRALVRDLRALPADRWSVVDHAAFAADPGSELARLSRFAGVTAVEPEPPAPDNAPLSPAAEIEAALERTADTAEVARSLFATVPAAPSAQTPAPQASRHPSGVASASLTQVLARSRSTLLVASPDAGSVSTVRRAGDAVHTAFADFPGATALAVRDGVLAVGTRAGVTTYQDVPAAGQRLGGTMGHDACFIPLAGHHTGNIGLRDMAYAGDALWLVAGRFSCLATLDGRNSFVPRWLPPFVSELAADDHCHLNGLCVVGDQPRYVTALGATDTQLGWAEGRDSGGVVVEVPGGEVVASGLALPHAPRWHGDRLWVLQSGRGELGTIDLDSGAFEAVAQVPGFPRALTLAGSLAFVGVSAHSERQDGECGVWVVDVDSGQVVAFLRFEEGVEEVTAVHVLAGSAYAGIAGPGSDAALNSFVLPDA